MTDSDQKRAWITSVLRVDFWPFDEPEEPFDEARFRKRWASAADAWRDAIETVDGQIEALRVALLRSRDPVLAAIADGGLAQLTGDFKTPVMASLFDIPKTEGAARRKAAKAARAAYEAFRTHVLHDERIVALDRHAKSLFGVNVTIGDEIAGGLDRLEREIDYLLTAG